MSKFTASNDFWWGYLIGLYEGEGSLNLTHSKANPDRVYARFWIRMTDREPLENIQRGFGGVLSDAYREKGTPETYKVKYRWSLARVNEFLELARDMLPFLSPRRQTQVNAALAVVLPTTQRLVRAGSRRDGIARPYRAKKSGELVCPTEPEESTRGYRRHHQLGIPVCDICRASFRLYYNERNKWRRDKISNLPESEREGLRVKSREYTRRWQAKQRALKAAGLISAPTVVQKLTPN